MYHIKNTMILIFVILGNDSDNCQYRVFCSDGVKTIHYYGVFYSKGVKINITGQGVVSYLITELVGTLLYGQLRPCRYTRGQGQVCL